jgi:hypothetical protein
LVVDEVEDLAGEEEGAEMEPDDISVKISAAFMPASSSGRVWKAKVDGWDWGAMVG